MKTLKMLKWLLGIIATLILLLLSAETYLHSYNIFPIKRWIDTDAESMRENYVMPTSQWGVLMYAHRFKPIPPIKLDASRFHDWKWNQSKRFPNDTDGIHRIDLSEHPINFEIPSFGLHKKTLGNKDIPFYTDYYYLSLPYFRNWLILVFLLLVATKSLLSNKTLHPTSDRGFAS